MEFLRDSMFRRAQRVGFFSFKCKSGGKSLEILGNIKVAALGAEGYGIKRAKRALFSDFVNPMAQIHIEGPWYTRDTLARASCLF